MNFGIIMVTWGQKRNHQILLCHLFLFFEGLLRTQHTDRCSRELNFNNKYSHATLIQVKQFHFSLFLEVGLNNL